MTAIAVDAPRPLARTVSFRRWPRPAVVFVATACLLGVVVWQSSSHLSRGDAAFRPRAPIDRVAGGWLWFDSAWYVDIADHGYWYLPGQQSPVAFFPAYPLTVRAVAAVTDSTPAAAMLVTFGSGLAAALLLAVWCDDRMRRRARTMATLALLWSPYAWYLYGTAYADALFLAAALAAFVLFERRRPLEAGLCGFVATAARPVGIAVVAGLAVAAFTSGRRRDRAAPLVAAGGLATWMLYLWIRFGNPLAFAAVEGAPGWDQPPGWQTWFKVRFLDQLVHGDPLYSIRLLPQALLVVGALALLPAVVRRFGWTYGVYTAVVVGVPFVGSGTFQGCGRYLLAAFPLYALAGEWLSTRSRRSAIIVLGTSATILLVLTSFFARGFYLS